MDDGMEFTQDKRYAIKSDLTLSCSKEVLKLFQDFKLFLSLSIVHRPPQGLVTISTDQSECELTRNNRYTASLRY